MRQASTTTRTRPRPGASVTLRRHLNINQARAIIEDDHGHDWRQFAFTDCPHAVTWHQGSARIDAAALFAWLGY